MEKMLYHFAERVLRKFGVTILFKAVSVISWFFIPFLIWIQIYQLLGPNYFVSSWLAILGIVILIFYVIFTGLSLIQGTLLDIKLMKYIEYAKNIFSDPKDPESEKKFRIECSKFTVPYLHLPPMLRFSFRGYLSGLGTRFHVFRVAITPIIHIGVSYLLIVAFIHYQPFLTQMWINLVSEVEFLSKVNYVLQFFARNIILLTIIAFCFSLFYFPLSLRKAHLTFRNVVFETLCDIFSIFTRCTALGILIISSPWILKMRRRRLTFEPFTFPTSLPLIFQKSVYNIEHRICNVTKWSYIVKDEDDIAFLKKIIYQQTDIPLLIRWLCLQVNTQDALKSINESKPILYLGIIDNRCAIIGRITYMPDKKIFRAEFTFDNQFVKNEFKSIAEIEINEQKKLKELLPTKLSELISKLDMREGHVKRN